MFEKKPLPDGYEYTGRTPHEIQLIDPEQCPAGHPADLIRRGWNHCATHGSHNNWRCACGQQIWRVEGQFVGELCGR